MLKLYHNDMSACAQKVRFVLAVKQLEWQSEELNLRQGDQQRPEYLKINPKGLVPALEHDGNILVESNIIVDYLNEAFPHPSLMSKKPLDRAKVRWWMKKLDDGLHLELAVLSFGIAYRIQLLDTCNGDMKLVEKHLSRIPDAYMRDVQAQVMVDGMDSPRFFRAVNEFAKLLDELDAQLAEHHWIASDKMSLADIAFAPYATRLDHLHMQGLWNNRPHFKRWYEQLKSTAGYQQGLTDWFNLNYLELMDRAGFEAWPKIQAMLDDSQVS
jgi:glutathione S-transferase